MHVRARAALWVGSIALGLVITAVTADVASACGTPTKVAVTLTSATPTSSNSAADSTEQGYSENDCDDADDSCSVSLPTSGSSGVAAPTYCSHWGPCGSGIGQTTPPSPTAGGTGAPSPTPGGSIAPTPIGSSPSSSGGQVQPGAPSTPPAPLAFSVSTLPKGQIGSPYNSVLSAVGGTPPYFWMVATGSTLPPGLALSGTTGAITGVPTTAGTSTFSIDIRDSSGTTVSGTFELTVDRSGQTITFTSSPPAEASVGSSYIPVAVASSGLPVSFTIDASTTAGACSLTGSAVSFLGTGTCVLDANQAGNVQFAPAPQAQQSIPVVTGAPVHIAVPSPPLTPRLAMDRHTHFGPAPARVSVRLTCQRAPCTGTISLSVARRFGHGFRHVTLATGTYAISTGGRVSLGLTATAAGRRILPRSDGRPRWRTTATITLAGTPVSYRPLFVEWRASRP